MKQIYCSHCLHIIGLPDDFSKPSVTCPACGEEVAAQEIAGDPEAMSRARKVSRPKERVMLEIGGFVALIVVGVLVYVFFISGNSSQVNTEEGRGLYDKTPAQIERERIAAAEKTEAERLEKQRQAEEKRLAEQKRLEEQRKLQKEAEEKRLEEERIDEEKRKQREAELEAQRREARKLDPIVTWLDDYDDYEPAQNRHLDFYKASQCMKQMQMGAANTAAMGVGFGSEVSGKNDEAYKAFKLQTIDQFEELLGKNDLTLFKSSKTIELQFNGGVYEMQRASSTNPLFQLFIGVQEGKAVFYWFNGPKILLKKFQPHIGKAKYSID